jgi:hypothetical protein
MADGTLQDGLRLADRLALLDKEIAAWGRLTRSQLIGQLLSLNLQGRLDAKEEEYLENTINYHSKRQDGELERVSIRFARHGIYLERGVGKYRKVGSAAATAAARPWLAPILPGAVQALADRLSEGYADVVAAEASLRIPGVLETKISR